MSSAISMGPPDRKLTPMEGSGSQLPRAVWLRGVRVTWERYGGWRDTLGVLRVTEWLPWVAYFRRLRGWRGPG